MSVPVCVLPYMKLSSSLFQQLWKQSDNPGMANPGTAAQAVSAHADSTQEGTPLCVDTTCRGLVFKAAALKCLFSAKKKYKW